MKKLEKILSEVQSPFTDEFIKDLIKIYINNGCDFHTVYKIINKVNEESLQRNEYVSTLVKVIMERGTNVKEGKDVQDSFGKYHRVYETKPVYNRGYGWMKVTSNPEAFDKYNTTDLDGTGLSYRIYLNLKGKDKLNCVMEYIEECHRRGLDYNFKFSEKDGRDDEIVIQSIPEHFLENLSIIQELTKQMQIGTVPMLIGKYENNIGVAEDYYYKIVSPTEARIHLLGAAHIKYILDHRDIALELCSSKEKSSLEWLIQDFDDQKEDKVRENRTVFEKINNVERASQNIYKVEEMYGGVSLDIQQMSGLIKKMYDINPDDFLEEVTSNVRYIGNKVFGISKDMIFSVITEDNMEASKKKDEVDRD